MTAAILRLQRVECGQEKEKLHYMHANPVRERLVKHPQEWPWSSFAFYAYDEQGLIRIDAVE